MRRSSRRGHGRWPESLEELPRIKRKTLDISPLALGIERIEGEARFSAAADATDHDQLVLRNVEVDILKIVDPHAAKLDLRWAFGFVCHAKQVPHQRCYRTIHPHESAPAGDVPRGCIR